VNEDHKKLQIVASDMQTCLSEFRKNQPPDKNRLKIKLSKLIKWGIIDKGQIPTHLKFEIEQLTYETFQFNEKFSSPDVAVPEFQGLVKKFILDIVELLAFKENGQTSFKTEKGIELFVDPLILFLNKNFYEKK